jgi:hypothetical protein
MACVKIAGARGVESEVDAVVRQFLDRVGRVAGRHIDNVCRTELHGQRQASRNHIDRDDTRRTHDFCRHHRAQANRSSTEDCDRLSGADLQRVDHRASSGHHSASQRSHDLEW